MDVDVKAYCCLGGVQYRATGCTVTPQGRAWTTLAVGFIPDVDSEQLTHEQLLRAVCQWVLADLAG